MHSLLCNLPEASTVIIRNILLNKMFRHFVIEQNQNIVCNKLFLTNSDQSKQLSEIIEVKGLN